MERVWKVMDEPEPPRQRPGERLLPYFSAFGLVAAGFILHLGFAASKDSRAFVLFFVPAVLAGAVMGGFWPALFATVLGLLSVAVVLARQQSLDLASVA